ncbi:MAG: ergothioneine biosynthesis protein EgtB [Rhizobacter sp.]|nr:ergothioneine biosynthesis protein EgtB [Rhizobacter sp.]
MNRPDRHSEALARRPALAKRYEQVRAATMKLAAPLSPEDCQVQSMPDASPVKWHLAHVSWFFETFVLERFEPRFRPFDTQFRMLFNSYYQGIGERWPRPQRGLLTRPALEEVLDYRARVDQRMLVLLDAPMHDEAFDERVNLGLHHEQQHQELLLTDIKHALSFNPERGAYARRWPIGAVQPQPMQWHAGGAELAWIGHDGESDGAFCFDNETPRHRALLAPHDLASRPVNYGEYLEFIDDGGYRRPELWLSMGWDWVCAGRRTAPLYWSRQEGEWLNHTLQGIVALDPHTPVCHLSYFEADAYARWAGARLPTEQEWEHAARRLRSPVQGNFADRGALHPMPPDRAGDDAPVQMWGDVWEWTSSSYAPYPGYRIPPGAVGEYNGKFMCNQYVLRGGSCATPAGHVRAGYRNFFPPDAQWQFSGLRLARDA